MDGPNQPRSVATFVPAVMRVVTALCAVVALFVGAAAAASAQAASPMPAASPAGQTMPGPGSNPAGPNPQNGQNSAPPPPALGHLPIIDIVTTFTQPAYYNTPGQIKNFDPIDVGGTVRLPVTRKFSLFFDRITEGTLNQPLQCIRVLAEHGEVSCPNDSRDVVLQYHGTYTFDRHWSLDVGDSFRHREQISALTASGVSNVPFPYTVSSTEHHFGYAGLSYTTQPVSELFHATFVFSLTGEAQNVDHHVAALCTAGNKAADFGLTASCGGLTAAQIGYYDANPHQSVYYESTQGVTAIVPVDPKHGTSFVANERWGALNFYENAALVGGIGVPYRWNSALSLQLSKRFSPGFTLALRHQDYHGIPGYGVPFPNSLHVGSWDVIGTFHLDTNTWFH